MPIIISSRSETNERALKRFIEQSNADKKERKLQLVCNGEVRASAALDETDIDVQEPTDEQA